MTARSRMLYIPTATTSKALRDSFMLFSYSCHSCTVVCVPLVRRSSVSGDICNPKDGFLNDVQHSME